MHWCMQGQQTNVHSCTISSRVIHSPVDGIEKVVVDPREVVMMHIPCDAGPPTNVHQTSSKLRPTLAL